MGRCRTNFRKLVFNTPSRFGGLIGISPVKGHSKRGIIFGFQVLQTFKKQVLLSNDNSLPATPTTTSMPCHPPSLGPIPPPSTHCGITRSRPPCPAAPHNVDGTLRLPKTRAAANAEVSATN